MISDDETKEGTIRRLKVALEKSTEALRQERKDKEVLKETVISVGDAYNELNTYAKELEGALETIGRGAPDCYREQGVEVGWLMNNAREALAKKPEGLE